MWGLLYVVYGPLKSIFSCCMASALTMSNTSSCRKRPSAVWCRTFTKEDSAKPPWTPVPTWARSAWMLPCVGHAIASLNFSITELNCAERSGYTRTTLLTARGLGS